MSSCYKLTTSLLFSASFELIFFHLFTVTRCLSMWFISACAHFICVLSLLYVLFPDIQHHLFNIVKDTMFLQKTCAMKQFGIMLYCFISYPCWKKKRPTNQLRVRILFLLLVFFFILLQNSSIKFLSSYIDLKNP